MKSFRQHNHSLSIKTPESALHPAASRAQNFITTNYIQRLIKHAMANISTAYIRYITFSITLLPDGQWFVDYIHWKTVYLLV